jgi:rare lipoprotein A
MFGMSAAHPTFPIPSYARVTNLANGNKVIVRINDRGPFHSDRIIDLSYTAAYKLGYLGSGSADLQVERILPDEIRQMEAARRNGGATLASASTTSASAPAAAPESPAVTTEAVPMPVAMVSAVPGPEPVAAQPAAANAVVSAAGGYYLQLGAFSRPENAQAVRQRYAQSGLPAIDVAQSNALYRVYGGPFASRAEAESAARRLQPEGRLPVIVQR